MNRNIHKLKSLNSIEFNYDIILKVFFIYLLNFLSFIVLVINYTINVHEGGLLWGIFTTIPSNSAVIFIWHAILVHLSLKLGIVYSTSSSYSEGFGNLLYNFYIYTLQVVQASCLSHNPYTFILLLTDLLVTSMRLSPTLIMMNTFFALECFLWS